VELDGFDHHAGQILSSRPLSVESTSQQWAYVVSVPLPLADSAVATPALISATVVVHDGLVGALVVANDFSEVLALTRLPAGIGRQRLDLVVQQRSPAHLVFRNLTPGNRCCRFTVESVSIQEAGPDALAPPSRLDEVLEGDPPRINISKLRTALLAARDDR
jgi:hypothetical protein